MIMGLTVVLLIQIVERKRFQMSAQVFRAVPNAQGKAVPQVDC